MTREGEPASVLEGAADGSFHAAWPDTRNGVFQIYTARMLATLDAPANETRPLEAPITSMPLVSN